MLNGNKIKFIAFICAMLLLPASLNFTRIYGILLLFFIPGFAFSLVLFRNIALEDRIGISIILSISLNILVMFAANYFLDVEITALNTAALILITSLLFFLIFLVVSYFRIKEFREIKNSIRNLRLKKDDALKCLLLILAVLLVFNIIYAVHQDYPYPYHTDEWENLAESVAIMENHDLLDKAPNCKGINKKLDLEIGSHLFLAELFLLTGADPAMSYKYLPGLFAAISAFMLFLIIRRYNFYAAILAMIFFAALKTNISILGLWILAPLTLSIAMIYGILFMFLNAIQNRLSFFLAASISLLALAVIHPISAVFVYMVILLYILLNFVYYLFCTAKNLLTKIKKILHNENHRFSLSQNSPNFEDSKILTRNIVYTATGKIDTIFTKKNIAGFGILFLIPFLSFIYFLAVLSNGSMTETIKWFITKFIIFPKFTGISSLVYLPAYLPDIYGTLGIGLAVIGILYLFYMRKKWGNSGLLAVAALTGIINLILFHFPHIGSFILEGFAFIFGIFGVTLVFNLPEYFTLFIFYERLIYYTMIFLAPLSAIGLYAAAKSVASIGMLNRIHKYAGVFLCTILIATALTLTFSGYYEEKEKLYKMITDDDYDAIKWIEENKGTGHVILARTEVSMTIYSVSRNYIVAGTSHEDNCPRENVNDVHRFFMGDCSERLKILKKHNVRYVITDFEISCGLKEIYRNKKDYVYEAV